MNSDSNTQGCTSSHDSCSLYHEEFDEPIERTESFVKGMSAFLENLREAHELAKTIDCDYGCASAELSDETLTITIHVPELSGPADDLVSLLDWDERNMDYDPELDLYQVELAHMIPTLVNPDSFVPDGD